MVYSHQTLRSLLIHTHSKDCSYIIPPPLLHDATGLWLRNGQEKPEAGLSNPSMANSVLVGASPRAW